MHWASDTAIHPTWQFIHNFYMNSNHYHTLVWPALLCSMRNICDSPVALMLHLWIQHFLILSSLVSNAYEPTLIFFLLFSLISWQYALPLEFHPKCFLHLSTVLREDISTFFKVNLSVLLQWSLILCSTKSFLTSLTFPCSSSCFIPLEKPSISLTYLNLYPHSPMLWQFHLVVSCICTCSSKVYVALYIHCTQLQRECLLHYATTKT